jgi:hypothetical protein
MTKQASMTLWFQKQHSINDIMVLEIKNDDIEQGLFIQMVESNIMNRKQR